jgi:hypothetical protein
VVSGQVWHTLCASTCLLLNLNVAATAAIGGLLALCMDFVDAKGSARVIRCLQEHRRSLTGTCAAALFDHEVGVVLLASSQTCCLMLKGPVWAGRQDG